MVYGICNLSSIPIRKEPAEQSEMRSQVIFGEHFHVLETTEKWARIMTIFDNYEGWIDKKMIFEISETVFDSLNKTPHFVLPYLVNLVQCDDQKIPFLIAGGSTLPFFNPENNTFKIGTSIYRLSGDIIKNLSNLRANIVNMALNYLNSSYLWGGRTPFGIDCSGLTQIVYKINGIPIPRDASQQVTAGQIVNFINDAKPGDLAFFDNDEGVIVHVGIVLEKDKIIHASGKVRIDILDHQGIYNPERNKYTHKLRVLKNVIGD